MAGQGQRAPRIAQPATLQKLMTPIISMPEDPNRAAAISGVSQYGLGWALVKMPWTDRALPFHGGSNTTNKAHIWIDTERDAVIGARVVIGRCV